MQERRREGAHKIEGNKKSTAKSLRGAFGKNSMNKCGIMLLLVDTISNLYIRRLRSL